MSTNLALVDPVAPSRAPRPSREDRRERPELVEVAPSRAQRRARPRIAYAIVAVSALGVLLLAQLGISMVLSQGAYTLNSLDAEQTKLTRTQQSLSEELRVLDSPQNLARNAQGLGMIANSTPVYLDPETGRVYGTPTPAKADQATAATQNLVPNSLLQDVPLVTKGEGTEKAAAEEGDTAKDTTSSGGAAKDTTGNGGAAKDTTSTGDAEKTGGASASDGASPESSVESDPNQLQAPTTR
ncbi:hypothetical protein ABC270_08735 [Curtobacterium sp. 1P10AnD]|uniref:hypothetical protein n=1 Tax=Curtobacterium sp. 1P10AnD TaxID=3132283 RepID=UPI00399FF53E